jgi:hypothetical protein
MLFAPIGVPRLGAFYGDNEMNIPGFTAEASLYQTHGHYRVAGAPNNFAGGEEILPQLCVGLSSGELYWCRLFCAYCRFYGYYCWPCYICGWIIVLGGLQASPTSL